MDTNQRTYLSLFLTKVCLIYAMGKYESLDTLQKMCEAIKALGSRREEVLGNIMIDYATLAEPEEFITKSLQILERYIPK